MATSTPARYLLDTNICIYIAKGHPLAVRHHFEKHTLQELAMSTITVGDPGVLTATVNCGIPCDLFGH